MEELKVHAAKDYSSFAAANSGPCTPKNQRYYCSSNVKGTGTTCEDGEHLMFSVANTNKCKEHTITNAAAQICCADV